MRRLTALLLLPVLALAAPVAAQDFPALTGRVVDQADIIPADIEADLTGKLEALETSTRRQFVIATLDSLQGYDINDYGYRLGREWGIGDEERNDGLLLVVAPNERKVRVEVGYGLEPVVTDGFSWRVINQAIIPRFKDGDMPGGIVAGADMLIAQLELPEEEARAIAEQAGQRGSGDNVRNMIGGFVFLVMFLLFFVFPIIAAIRYGGRRRRGFGNAVGNIILWEVLNAAARSGSGRSHGGFSGGSFGGGGGFSGGGGSFGGGGASGGW